MRIEAVSPADVRRWWEKVVPGIKEVRDLCKEPWIPEEVFVRLAANQATLFVFLVGNALQGFAVCEVCNDAGGKYLNVWILHFIGGCEANRQELLHWVDSVARSAGCPVARFTSPRAWAKLLAGAFKEKAVIYERDI